MPDTATAVLTPRWPLVLFDLDGTLANSLDVIVASYEYAFGTVTGRVIARAEALTWIGQGLDQTFGREDPAHAAALSAAYREFNEAHVDAMITGYPGVPDLLRDLRAAGVVTGVVTAKRRPIALRTMRLAGVEGLIDLAASDEDTLAHKPDPAPLLAACARLGLEPSTGCYVGDAIGDMRAAQGAGMAAIAVTWGAGVEADLVATRPDALCPDVPALRHVLSVG